MAGHPAFELALEVGLIGKTAGKGHFRQGLPLAQQGAGVANAPIEQVGVGVMPQWRLKARTKWEG